MKYVTFFVFLSVFTFAVSCGQQKKYVQYSVKQGETMRTIAKKLDVKTKYLLRLNPDVGRNPAVNTVIVIPNKKINFTKDSIKQEVVSELKQEEDIEEISDELKRNFVVYEVKKGDAFYSLTRFYNVSQEELIALNPELSEGLKVGQLIKIKIGRASCRERV